MTASSRKPSEYRESQRSLDSTARPHRGRYGGWGSHRAEETKAVLWEGAAEEKMRDGEAGTAVLAKRRLREFGPSSQAFIPYGESSLFVLVSHNVALLAGPTARG